MTEEQRLEAMKRISDSLQRTKKGPLPTVNNALIILRQDPLLAGMFGFSKMGLQYVMHRPPPPADQNAPPLLGPYPRPMRDADAILIQAYLQRTWIAKIAAAPTRDALTTAAELNPFHPIVNFFNALPPWDGNERNWLREACDAEDNDYTAAVSAKFLIAAVRRIRQPGSKWDFVPVLMGPQRIGKSEICRALFEPWFTNQLPMDLSSKDASQQMAGVWGIELADLAQLMNDRNHLESIKAFLTRRVDRFRPPFGRSVVEIPRQCVIVGTSNPEQWGKDHTGNTRFLPVATPRADYRWIEDNRSQLWAEAAQREAAGESTWLDDPDVAKEAARQQEAIYDEDAWADPINDFLTSILPDPITGDIDTTIFKVLTAIGVQTKDQDRSKQMRAAKVVSRIGWKAKVVWDQKSSKTKRVWTEA